MGDVGDLIYRARCPHGEMRCDDATEPGPHDCALCGRLPWQRWRVTHVGWSAGTNGTYRDREQAASLARYYGFPLRRVTRLRRVVT